MCPVMIHGTEGTKSCAPKWQAGQPGRERIGGPVLLLVAHEWSRAGGRHRRALRSAGARAPRALAGGKVCQISASRPTNEGEHRRVALVRDVVHGPDDRPVAGDERRGPKARSARCRRSSKGPRARCGNGSCRCARRVRSGGRKPERSGPSSSGMPPWSAPAGGAVSSRCGWPAAGPSPRARCGKRTRAPFSQVATPVSPVKSMATTLWPRRDVAARLAQPVPEFVRDRHRAAPEPVALRALVGVTDIAEPVEPAARGDVEQEEDEAHLGRGRREPDPAEHVEKLHPPHPSRPWTRSGRAPRHRRSCRRQGPAEAVRDRSTPPPSAAPQARPLPRPPPK